MRKVLIVGLGLVLLLVAPVHADLTGPITNFADVEKQLEALTRKGDILEQKVQTLSDRVTTLEQHAQAATGVYERVRPAVVSLQAEGEDNLGLPQRVNGSGVLIWTNAQRTEALVLTAAHVARQARGVRVVLYDGRLLAGEVASTDIDLDWVTLRVKGEALPAAVAWGDSGSLKIGTPLVVIGDPLGYRGAMALGVLTGRTLRWTNSGYEFLQTDAAVSPGSSGGPMFDLDGNLVGLVVGKEVANHAEGLAFALPVDTIQQSFALTQRKDQARAYLGAVLHESDDRHEGMLAAGGLTVVALDPQGPLAAAGVKVGDEIRQLGSRAVSTLADVRRLVDTIPPGTQMALTYSRGTQVQASTFTLGAAPIWQAKPVARDLAARSVQDGVF